MVTALKVRERFVSLYIYRVAAEIRGFFFLVGRDPLAGLNHWKDINAVAGLLRVYFRELEDPLFPSSHYQEFIKASCKYLVILLNEGSSSFPTKTEALLAYNRG